MHVLQIASYVVAACLALSRLLDVAKPFWSLLPSKVAAFIPSIVAMLPVAAAQFGVVKTEMDLVSALLVAGALLLPGARPKVDPPSA
jgi:hypothetical protein